ncbi:MAG: DUF2178 domain-containing protein [Candidatus Micrarchaeota archaeon]
MSDKLRLLLIVGLGIMVALSFIAYGLANKSNDVYSLALIAFAVITLLAIAGYGVREYKNLEKGLKLKDERTQNIERKAAANAFYISLYLLLAFGWYCDMAAGNASLPQFRDVSQAMSVAVGGMALIFGLCYLYVKKKEEE